MIKKIVRYRVKPQEVDAVRTAITEFVNAVKENEPETVYGSLQAEDGVSFVHAMAFADESAERQHRAAAYTNQFFEILYPRCEEAPEFITVNVLSSTKKGAGFLGEGRSDKR